MFSTPKIRQWFAFSIGFLNIIAAIPQSLASDDAPPAPEGDGTQSGKSAEKAFQDLLASIENPGIDFATAYAEAEDAGVSAQKLLEASLMNMMGQGDLEGLLDIAPSLLDYSGEFEFGMDKAFPSKSNFEGFVYSLLARKSFDEKADSDFRNYALAAYWASPFWAERLGVSQLIQDLRNREASAAHLASLSIPLDNAFRAVDGEPITLGEMLGQNKAVLFDFWASWCGPCMRLMPELAKKAKVLAPQGIYVAGVNTDQDEPLVKAKEVKEENQMEMPWLIDHEGAASLSQLLAIDSIPRMVLIGQEGKVLFSGHPQDPELGEALAKLGVEL